MTSTPTPPRRRSKGRLAALLLAALATTACSSSASSEAATMPTDFSALIDGMPATFNQWDTVTAPLGGVLLVNEPLVRWTGDEFEPGLAEEFEVASPTEYRYVLRDGVEFTDGTPLTAEDVTFTLEEGMDNTHYSTTWTVLSSIEDIVVEDDSTVVVTLTSPNPQFQHVVAQTGIVSKAFYEEHGDDVGTPAVGLVGTGPYLLDEFEPKTRAVLTANPDYWDDENGAAFDTVTFTTAEDDSARLLALQSDTANAIFETPIAQVDDLEAIDGFEVTTVPDSRVYVIQFDVTKPPFDDPKVRDAVRQAINREEILAAAFGGRADLASTLTRASSLEQVADPAQVEATLATFDEENAFELEAARRLIAESSVPDGFEMTLPLGPVDTNLSLVAQVIRQNLAELGIEVKIQQQGQEYYTSVMADGKHDGMTLSPFRTNTSDPGMPMDYFIPEDAVFNLTNTSFPDAEEALEAARSLAADDPERGPLLLEALTAWHNSGAVLPLAMPNIYVGLKAPMTIDDTFTNYWWMARWDLKVASR
jgi:peptide/nickel transport system substrate-binding protein